MYRHHRRSRLSRCSPAVAPLSGHRATPRYAEAAPASLPPTTATPAVRGRALPAHSPSSTRVMPVHSPSGTRALPVHSPSGTRALPAHPPSRMSGRCCPEPALRVRSIFPDDQEAAQQATSRSHTGGSKCPDHHCGPGQGSIERAADLVYQRAGPAFVTGMSADHALSRAPPSRRRQTGRSWLGPSGNQDATSLDVPKDHVIGRRLGTGPGQARRDQGDLDSRRGRHIRCVDGL
jgi:hypothetical protein